MFYFEAGKKLRNRSERAEYDLHVSVTTLTIDLIFVVVVGGGGEMRGIGTARVQF